MNTTLKITTQKTFVQNSKTSMLQNLKSDSKTVYQHLWLYAILAVIAAVGLLLDTRELTGVNVWLKPFKFMLSGIIYLFTTSYFVQFYPFSPRKKKFILNANTWVLTIDLLIIFIQGARGLKSHYNNTSLIDGILFATMGVMITCTVLLMVFFLVETARLKMRVPKPIQWSIFLAWIIMLVGSYAGGQMISQMSHTVGATDGGDGMAFTNWSTLAGDLRIAHFFGLHAIQIIPLFALFIVRKSKAQENLQLWLVSLFALCFGFWVFYTYIKAMQGLPLFG